MEPLLLAIFTAAGFIIAYNTYGRWLGRRIFELSAKRVCPSVELEDGQDYVPSPKSVVFGHHFTSIAGTGPIVGPAIAVLWGWLPALLWIVMGSILVGAVHDLGSLVVSLRNKGKTVGEIAGVLLNRRVRLLFMAILFMALTIVLAIFGLVIAAVFKQFPSAIFPCILQTPLAIGIGLLLRKQKIGLILPSIMVLGLMYLSVFLGDWGFLHAFNERLAAWPVWLWVVALLSYAYVASVLPVWLLLQPRDFINSLQLLSAMGLLVVGLAVAAFIGGAPIDGARPELNLVAPAIQWAPAGAPPIFPFLFITIACGAISGFHCLVSSGTSSKQLRHEHDARMVGYGAMMTEAFLATMVLLACAAGIGLGIVGEQGVVLTGEAAWLNNYSSWAALSGLAAKVGAFVNGAANFLTALGLSKTFSVALMGVMVASFAATTLDSACRLQRYVVQELAGALRGGNAGAPVPLNPLSWLEGRHGATIFAIIIATVLAAIPPAGSEWSLANAGLGGLLLWPLFGATNQLLGGLSFIVIAFYLWRNKKPIWFVVIPACIMLIMPMWAMFVQIFIGTAESSSWLSDRNWTLVFIGVATIALEIWMIAEALMLIPSLKEKISDVGATSPEVDLAKR